MGRRSNLMVLLGGAFLVVGAVLVYLVTNDSGGSNNNSSGGGGSTKVTVVVATADIQTGTLADAAIADGRLKETQVEAVVRAGDAVGSLLQLKGAAFTSSFAKNQQITLSGVRIINVRGGLTVPAGHEALAVEVGYVEGGAEYIAPGDRINVYAVIASTNCAQGPCPRVPRAELLLTNVEVLDVSNQTASRRGTAGADPNVAAPARAGGASITFLLSVTTIDAEKLIYQTSFENLYVTLTAKDAPPAGPTGGRDASSILSEEPNVAAGRNP